ncbi:MAG: 4-hydroxy-3-methylbut-2-enyl diphosphate reductase [Candidatus Aminicenantes bacterium]|nr:4-hydroxy-3-methylbut-2-enyl diphosphate reductase [Candidatus Aminicenantes bacterium]
MNLPTHHKVILAKNSGFCFGVKRAIDLALKTKEKVFTLGPLIHNPQVIMQLEQEGIVAIDSIDDIERGGKIIIRAHGIPRSVISRAKKKKISVIDATCPFVQNVQQIAESLSNEGYQVVIIGEANHPEIIGIADRVKNPIIIEDISEVSEIGRFEKIGVVAQTTQSEENYKKIIHELKKHSKKIKIFNTICSATKKNQDAAKELAKKSNLMIVVGGYNSGNTRRLAKLCSEIVETKHIEIADELKSEWFEKKEIIGVTGGASTPDWIIREVIESIEKEF